MKYTNLIARPTTLITTTSLFIGIISLFCALPNPASAAPSEASTPIDASIMVEADMVVAPVNQKVFGQFIKGADNYGIFSIPHPDLAVLHEGNGIWDSENKQPYEAPFAILKSYHPGALRYPDGLGVHGHDWKKTIGPVEERGDWKYGLNEFMQINEELGSEVIFVVSEYIGTPQDAADLVEYLNMPATEEYPWAMRRAEDGHPEPYGVKYYEIGNESWVDWRKTGKPEVRPPNEVGSYASAIAAAMKAVDPGIECGIPYFNESADWSREVLANITSAIDFVVIHTYPVKFGGPDMEGAKENQILEAMMASGYSTAIDLREDLATIEQYAGRPMPIAITEYNMGPTQQQKNLQRPYRFTLASAIGAGDYLGRLLNPDQHIVTAIYWSWLNGFFGPVHTYAGHPWRTLEKLDEPTFSAPHYIFELWGKYRGDELLETIVDTPTAEFAGWGLIHPMMGAAPAQEQWLSEINLLDGARQLPINQPGAEIEVSDNETLTIHYSNLTGNAFPNLFIRTFDDLPSEIVPPATGLVYRVSFDAKWVREEGSSTPNLGIGVMDHRGYNASGSAIAIRSVESATEWTTFEADYQPLVDTAGLVVLGRVEGGTVPVNGTLFIKNLKIEAWRSETYPERPLLSAYATKSADGKKLYLMVFNMSVDRALETEIEIDGLSATEATYTQLSAATASATNGDDATVEWTTHNEPLTFTDGVLRHRFPAHSATGFEFDLSE